MKGLEPPRPEAQDPKSCAATNYATSAIAGTPPKRVCKGMNFCLIISVKQGLQHSQAPGQYPAPVRCK